MTIKVLETCKLSKLNQKETDKLDRPLVIKLN